MSVILQEEKYRIIIGDNTWLHVVPTDPGAYSANALSVGNVVAQHKQYITEHKILQTNDTNYLGVEEAGKDLILHAIGNNALAPLKNNTSVLETRETLDVGPSTPEDSHQVDYSAEVQIQSSKPKVSTHLGIPLRA